VSRSASMLQVAALAGLEQVLNAALALDPKTGERLHAIDGRVIAIDVNGTGLRLFLQPQNGNLKVMGHYAGEVDTTLRGAPFAMLRLRTGRSGEAMFGGGVEIDGDVELGTRFQRIIEKLDIDWEEHLSRISGDIIAHQIGNSVRDLFTWGKRTANHLSEDITDYLQEETYSVPTAGEVNHFLESVDTLRSDVDRLEAKFKRLEKKLETKD
jgi:ubiquinone biosynthesis accessory factor UbiJ